MVRGRPARRKTQAAVRDGQAALRSTLDHTLLQVRHIHSAAVVAVAALRRQNCELDGDIASVLQRSVCDSLAELLDRLEAGSGNPHR
jgi:hypothetical protein